MDVTQQTATALGFPKAHYRIVERERRWLCSGPPAERVRSAERICDLYVANTRLRLREARPLDGSSAMLRLTRKADADARTRVISSVYLSEDDFAVLSQALTGVRLTKIRHRLAAPQGVSMCVDEFEGDLAGLFLCEVECVSDHELLAFRPPAFALGEVTDDARYTGYELARNGMPSD